MWKMTWRSYRNCAIIYFAGFFVCLSMGLLLYDPRTFEDDGIVVVFSIILAFVVLIAGVVFSLKARNLFSEEQKQEKPFKNPVPVVTVKDFAECYDELYERLSTLKELYHGKMIDREDYRWSKEKLFDGIYFSVCDGDDLQDCFSKLKNLYDHHLISEEEYERKKEELLEEL